MNVVDVRLVLAQYVCCGDFALHLSFVDHFVILVEKPPSLTGWLATLIHKSRHYCHLKWTTHQPSSGFFTGCPFQAINNPLLPICVITVTSRCESTAIMKCPSRRKW